MQLAMQIRQRIIEELKLKNITQKRLIQDCKLGDRFMQNIKTSVAGTEKLIKICDYLEVSLDYITGRTKNKNINL